MDQRQIIASIEGRVNGQGCRWKVIEGEVRR